MGAWYRCKSAGVERPLLLERPFCFCMAKSSTRFLRSMPNYDCNRASYFVETVEPADVGEGLEGVLSSLLQTKPRVR